jgi:hypothetical protein
VLCLLREEQWDEGQEYQDNAAEQKRDDTAWEKENDQAGFFCTQAMDCHGHTDQDKRAIDKGQGGAQKNPSEG